MLNLLYILINAALMKFIFSFHTSIKKNNKHIHFFKQLLYIDKINNEILKYWYSMNIELNHSIQYINHSIR